VKRLQPASFLEFRIGISLSSGRNKSIIHILACGLELILDLRFRHSADRANQPLVVFGNFVHLLGLKHLNVSISKIRKWPNRYLEIKRKLKLA